MFNQLDELPLYLGLNDQVYDVLKRSILTHKLRVGTKLDVNQLAKRWGISRSPVHDAVQRLMVEGIITVIPRRGTFVANLDAEEVIELMDVRLMFELRAAEIVTSKLTPVQLANMKKILTEMDELLEAPALDYVSYSNLDIKLHSLPILWSENKRLYKIYQSLHFQWHMTRLLKSRVGHLEHWEIFKAYESGSLEQVKSALTRHIDAGKASINELSTSAIRF
jgi:GntR family transcriptional regulator, rspAB operon transcriptional repressor